MSESRVSLPQARAVLRCHHASAPALQNEAAARWLLRHVAFNSGFELHPGAGGQWSRSRAVRPGAQGFELNLDMRDGCFVLRSTPAQRRLELKVLLGPGARHLHGNLPRLVEELATACDAALESLELAADDAGTPAGPAAEPLVLPA